MRGEEGLRRQTFLSGALLLLLAAPATCDPSLPLLRRGLPSKIIFSVDRFGAVGDGLHNDTEAVCSSPLEAVLKVPRRKTYLLWPADFSGPCSSNSTFSIIGAIAAPDDPSLWRDHDPRQWLLFDRLNHLILRGGGTIDGRGRRWWSQSCKIKNNGGTTPPRSCRKPPRAVVFRRCENLRIQNLTMMNSPRMHLSLSNCSGVKVSALRVIAPADSPNTDGIHISSSSCVEIKNSEIRTGDDCISIVSNSSLVKIRDVHCGPGHGISIGSLGKHGSWSNVSSINVRGVNFTDTSNGFRIKTWQGGRGFACRMQFKNAIMRNVLNPIVIDQYYCDPSSRPCPNETSAVKIEQVSFENIRGTSVKKIAINFACSDKFPCEKIRLKNIQLNQLSGDRASSYRWKARVSCSGFVDPPVCGRKLGDWESFEFLFGESLRLICSWIVSAISFRIEDFVRRFPFIH